MSFELYSRSNAGTQWPCFDCAAGFGWLGFLLVSYTASYAIFPANALEAAPFNRRGFWLFWF